MKHMSIFTLLLICLFFFFLVQAEDKPSDQAREQSQPPALVRVTQAVQGSAAGTTDLIGTLYFERTSRVSPEEAARITSVTFREGDRVKKGDILIRMDSRILEKELALQKAKLVQAEIRIENAKRNLDRQTQLFKKDVATEASYDDLRFSHKERVQEHIALSREVDILTIRLAKHVVKAPFDGIILEKQAEVGEWIQPSSVLCVLGATDALYVQVPVAEHLIRISKTGDELPVTLNAFDTKLNGTLEGIRPEADPRTKNISLKLRLDYTGPVAVNMSATVAVPVSEKKDLIILPRDALVQVMGTDMVYTVTDNTAQSMPVEIVYSRGARIGVASPALKPGMTVVTEGNERLRPGQPVTIQVPENRGE